MRQPATATRQLGFCRVPSSAELIKFWGLRYVAEMHTVEFYKVNLGHQEKLKLYPCPFNKWKRKRKQTCTLSEKQPAKNGVINSVLKYAKQKKNLFWTSLCLQLPFWSQRYPYWRNQQPLLATISLPVSTDMYYFKQHVPFNDMYWEPTKF